VASQNRDCVLELSSRNADVCQLRTRAFQLRLSERHVGHRHDPALEAILRQLQIFLVRTDRLLEQDAIGVEALHLEVVARELGLIQEPRAFEIGRRRLRDGGIGGDAATPPDPSRTPLLLMLPGKTMIRLLPMLWICAWIRSVAPAPTPTMAMTAATPMMMPSIVSADRVRFT
jgi:hypothetical protein